MTGRRPPQRPRSLGPFRATSELGASMSSTGSLRWRRRTVPTRKEPPTSTTTGPADSWRSAFPPRAPITTSTRSKRRARNGTYALVVLEARNAGSGGNLEAVLSDVLCGRDRSERAV
jgi:hypothetical protein